MIAESIRAEAARRGVSLWQVRKDRGETRVVPGRVQAAARLTPELHDRLRDEADARDVSVNWMLTKAVEEFLARLAPADEFRLTR